MEAPFDDVLRSGAVEIHIADVYVHKLRVKLEDAMAGQAFLHTHFGSVTGSRPSVHALFTTPPPRASSLGSARACDKEHST
jgi:hypothetical protein